MNLAYIITFNKNSNRKKKIKNLYLWVQRPTLPLRAFSMAYAFFNLE
jgi:hypothetical protein